MANPERDIKAQLESAWVVTRDYFNKGQSIETRIRVLGIFDPQIPSTAMLQIVEQLAVCHLLTLAEQMQAVVDEGVTHKRVGFMYLNDGSAFEDHILGGESWELEAVRASEIILYKEACGQEFLYWKYPRMLVDENNERFIDYWEEFTVAVDSSRIL